jgi:hypothetical protein
MQLQWWIGGWRSSAKAYSNRAKTTLQVIVIGIPQLTAQPRQERLLGSGEGKTISCCPQWHIAWIFVRIVW